MKDGLPVILVSGNNFVAKRLVELFLKDEVFVVVLGESEDWIGYPEKKFLVKNQLEKIDFRADYVFDFEANKGMWTRAEVDESRLVVIEKDNMAEEVMEKLAKKSVDWRILCGYNVYGPGMDLDENWVARVMKSAVMNKNLEIPKENGSLRCIFVDDFVELAKKCCFVPGLSGERVIVFGKKIGIDAICRTLVNKAKMTKKGAVVKNREEVKISDNKVEVEWDKISWDGGGGFELGVGQTLQYFFSEIDLISRGKKKKVENKKRRIPAMRVEVEEDLEEVIEKKEIKKEEITKKIKEKQEKYEKYEWKPFKKLKVDESFDKAQDKEKIIKETVVKKVLSENMDDPEDKIDLSQFDIKPAYKQIEKIEIKKEEKKARKSIRQRLSGFSLKKINWKLVIMPLVMLVTVYTVLLISFFGSLWRVARTAENMELVDKNIGRIDGLENRLRLVSLEGRLFSYKGWGEVLRVLKTVMDLEKELVTFFESANKYSGAVFGEENIDWKRASMELKSTLITLENKLGLLEARTSGDWSFLPNRLRSFVLAKSKEVSDWRGLVSKISESLDSFLYIAATDGGRRDFLVLMQNEMELRPSGGFIGSFGVLSFEDGRFLGLDVGDIYDIDGQLKGHVEPPAPIKEVLGEPSWYLRDANWEADFTKAARDLEWFFDKETGRKIDGIITINLSVAKALLDQLGEVWVPDFDEKINSDNLFDQAEFYSEKAFFAGSRQKSTFLGKLSSQLMEEIKNQKGMGQMGVVRAMLESLDKNEMQIYVHDKKTASNLADLGWDGSIYSGGCGMENCMADYLYIVEANLGVNKSNYFLRRDIERTVDISDRAISRVVKINYENLARTAAWPGEDYKNYMRVYLPDDTNISEVSIYDSNDVTDRKVLTGEDLIASSVGDKRELAFLVTVPVTRKRTVEIRYSSQIDLNTATTFSYLSYVQKQSGYGETPIVSLVSYPVGWQAIQVEPGATVVNSKLLFDEKMDKDLKMGVVISK